MGYEKYSLPLTQLPQNGDLVATKYVSIKAVYLMLQMAVTFFVTAEARSR